MRWRFEADSFRPCAHPSTRMWLGVLGNCDAGRVVRPTTGVKLRSPEGAQRPRASSASTSEFGSTCRPLSIARQRPVPRQPVTDISQEYRDLSPRQVIPALAEQGTYIASEATAYRVLHKHDMQKHRANT